MIAPVLLVLAAAPEVHELRMNERSPVALVILAPRSTMLSASASEILRMVSRELEADTDLAPELIDTEAVKSCKGQLRCIVRQVRASVPYLFVLSLLSSHDKDHVSAVFIDVQRAIKVGALATDTDESTSHEIEKRIIGEALLASEERASVQDAEALEAFVRRLIGEKYRAALEAAGHWDPYGTIEIQCELPGLEIRLDGQAAGVTSPTTTRIAQVLAGDRALSLTRPDLQPIQATLRIDKRQVAHFEAHPSPLPGDHAAIRKGVVWGSAAVVVAGLAITGVAIAQSNEATNHVFCWSCGSSELVKLGSSPIPTAALGWSLVGLGATAGLSTLLFGDDGDLPIIPLIAGAVVFGGSMALSIALDGKSSRPH
jgi:hypothetical protein